MMKYAPDLVHDFMCSHQGLKTNLQRLLLNYRIIQSSIEMNILISTQLKEVLSVWERTTLGMWSA